MDSFMLKKWSYLDKFIHPIVMGTISFSLDIDSILADNLSTKDFKDSYYLSATIPLYLGFLGTLINSIYYWRKKQILPYLKVRFLLLFIIMSCFRVKETLIKVPSYQVPFIIVDLVNIAVTNLGTQALLEKIEDEKYTDIEFNHRERVYGKQWDFLGIPLNVLLTIQVVFSVNFLLYQTLYYFKRKSHPALYYGLVHDPIYGIVLLIVFFFSLLIALNSVVLIVGVKKKSIRILTAYYHIKICLILSLRCMVLAMVLKENELQKVMSVERTIANLTLLPISYILQFELAQVLRLITYLDLEDFLPVGEFTPHFYISKEYSASQQIDFFKLVQVNKHLKSFINSIKFHAWAVTLGVPLGEGNFAQVFQGTLKTFPYLKRNQRKVAIKVTKDNFGPDYFQSLVSELKTMKVLGKHDHLVELFGIVELTCYEGRMGIVSELCEGGCLLHHLHNLKSNFKGRQCEGLRKVFRLWSLQICCGMEYLSSRKVVHGDLATRNILLTNKFICKISDFGMSFRLYTYQVYGKSCQKALPFRWMAPESLSDLKFSTHTDVWSFGVVLWEIYSFGEMPWPRREWTGRFIQEIKDGKRLANPELCPEAIYENVLLSCWNLLPYRRPSFASLVSTFRKELRADQKLSFV